MAPGDDFQRALLDDLPTQWVQGATSSSLKSMPRKQEKAMSIELANCQISQFRVIVLCLAAALLGGACSGRGKEATVEISPEIYKINSIRSKLATPVVDEAIRLKPSKVTISACSTTPPRKIIQFEREFSARSKAELILVVSQGDCVIQ
jgi:hypothetical protein